MLQSTIIVSRFWILLLSLLAPGCTSPTSPRSSYDELPPPHLRDHAAPSGKSQTTQAIKLPDPATTEQVTLSTLLAFADARSPVLAVARSTRSRAEAARIAASPALPANPELELSAGPRIASAGTGVDIGVSLSQRLEIAGERGRRVDVADRLRQLTEAEIEQVRWAVHCDVHVAFHRALVMRENGKLAERVVAFQDELLSVVERQVKAGDTPPFTLRLAQAEVAQARQAAVAATQAYRTARIQLAQLSGWPVLHPPVPLGKIDAPRDPPDLRQLLAMARKRLPLLEVRDASVKEAQARVASADRGAWPQPSLGVHYVREGSRAPEGPSHIVTGSVSVPLPIFESNQGERARARADLAVAQAEQGAARLLFEGDVAQAHAEMVAAVQRVQSYGSEIVPKFEENLMLLRRSFELGEIDLLELSIGRERFLRIQSDALAAQLDYFVAVANLERAVGFDLWYDVDHEEGSRESQ